MVLSENAGSSQTIDPQKSPSGDLFAAHRLSMSGFSPGSMPSRSLTALRSLCLQPRYRSVVWIVTCPSRIESDLVPRQRHGTDGRKCCDYAEIVIVAAMPRERPPKSPSASFHHPRPVRLYLSSEKVLPLLMPLASFQSSMATFTQPGIGMVRTWPAFPIKSAITHGSRSFGDTQPQTLPRT
jgi:hypothetical protein